MTPEERLLMAVLTLAIYDYLDIFRKIDAIDAKRNEYIEKCNKEKERLSGKKANQEDDEKLKRLLRRRGELNTRYNSLIFEKRKLEYYLFEERETNNLYCLHSICTYFGYDVDALRKKIMESRVNKKDLRSILFNYHRPPVEDVIENGIPQKLPSDTLNLSDIPGGGNTE